MLDICGGQQLLHVVLGGKLIRHIPDAIKKALAYEQPNPRNEPGHTVKVAPGTQLHRIVGADAPQGVVINAATASDGVIESLAYREPSVDTNKPFKDLPRNIVSSS